MKQTTPRTLRLRLTFVSALLVLAALMTVEAAVDPIRAQAAIDKFATQPTMKNASLTIAVGQLSDGKIIAGHNVDLACITASTMKTVTSSAALEQLGGDFAFETPVYLEGEVVNGVLKGNVVIVGVGDPTLGSRFFKDNLDIVPEVAQALTSVGIKRIEGRIIADNTLYPYPAYNTWWDVGDLVWSYGMGLHALNYCDNRTRLVFNGHNGELRDVRFEPAVPGLQVINRLERGTTDAVALHLEYASPAVVVSGTVADTTYYFDIANPLPDAMLVDSLTNTLARNGIKVRGRDLTPQGERWQLVAHKSPVLTDIVTSLLERSDNMFTEGLLHAVAVNRELRGLPENGVQAVNDVLAARGIDTKPKFQYDGSGLARANKAPATFFVDLLTKMAGRTYGARQLRLVDLMPRIGVNANIGDYLAESSLSGQIAVKSGSMTGVQCYVGYFPADKPEYCFAVLVNNWHGPRKDVKDGIDRLLMGVFNGY